MLGIVTAFPPVIRRRNQWLVLSGETGAFYGYGRLSLSRLVFRSRTQSVNGEMISKRCREGPDTMELTLRSSQLIVKQR